MHENATVDLDLLCYKTICLGAILTDWFYWSSGCPEGLVLGSRRSEDKLTTFGLEQFRSHSQVELRLEGCELRSLRPTSRRWSILLYLTENYQSPSK
ncbi:hypothetical protein K2173_005037 [Erythroxylum novogranatense]|uniref:Uncharacterized protein n=1 Tax=Erythroxylum novogranatense TaxID=1862640 RepID=A0AAV8TDL3_9ROSI|nr:hypothetical protein K2173_005037 [Erythroxylum novogranatense]